MLFSSAYSVQVSYGRWKLNIKIVWGLDESLEIQNFVLIIFNWRVNLQKRWFSIIVTVRINNLRLGKLLNHSFLSHFLAFSSNHVFSSDSQFGGTVWMGTWHRLWVLTGSSMSWVVSVLGVVDIINRFSEDWLSESIELILGFVNVVLNAISISIVDISWSVWFLPVADWFTNFGGQLAEFHAWLVIVIAVGIFFIKRNLSIKLNTREVLGL